MYYVGALGRLIEKALGIERIGPVTLLSIMQYVCLTALLAFSLAWPEAASAAINFSPQTITIIGTGTQNVTLTPPSVVPPGGLLLNLRSDNPAVAQVQRRAGFYPDGSPISQIPIVAVGPGTTVIHASGQDVPDTILTVTVTGPAPVTPAPVTPSPVTPAPVTPAPVTPAPVTPAPVTPAPVTPAPVILLPSGVTIAPGQQVAFPATLTNSAPPGGVFISLSSSDSSKVTIQPTSVFIASGATTSDAPVRITGISFGTAAISASAYNSTGDTKTVQVAGGSAALSFSPQSITLAGSDTQYVKLSLLDAVPPGGLLVNLSSNNPAVARVQQRAGFYPDGSAIGQIPIVAVGPGTTVIRAGAPPNFPDTFLTVTVIGSGAITLPDRTALVPNQSTAFRVILSTPAPEGGLAVTLASSDSSKLALSPTNVFFAGGSTTPATQPQMTGLAIGSATISASAPGYTPASQAVQIQPVDVGGMLSFSPTTLNMAANGTSILQLNLSTPALAGRLTVYLSSTNSAVTVPPTVTFPAGVSNLNLPITSVGTGSSVIHASALPGFPDTTATVNVVASANILLPANVNVVMGSSTAFSVTLDAPAPAGGVIITLLSSDVSKIVVSPATIFIPQGAVTASIQPQVTGVSAGNVSISASGVGYANVTQTVQVNAAALSSAFVNWHGACWQNYTLFGYTGNFQAIDFVLTTPTPVPVQGSLFFAPNCNPSQGIDNMNDNGALTGSRHMVQFFTHYPDTIPSSAMFWVGPRTSDGMCPAGAPCSGCVNYTKTTPDCGSLP